MFLIPLVLASFVVGSMVLVWEAIKAPVGFEDQSGFHVVCKDVETPSSPQNPFSGWPAVSGQEQPC